LAGKCKAKTAAGRYNCMRAVIILKYIYSWKVARELNVLPIVALEVADCFKRLRIESTGTLY
jgi:hypothetical protein